MLRLALSLILAATAQTRRLQQSDVQYGLAAFNAKFHTRARHLYDQEHHFHRRLFDHEEALPADRLQTYIATLHASVPLGVTPELTKSLETRGGLIVHTVVSGDLLMHGTRDHADALREQPEIRTVVPLLPELKLTPHFTKMLPHNATAPAAMAPGGAVRQGAVGASSPGQAPPVVSLLIRLLPRERHEHLRRPAEEVVPDFSAALAAACASEPGKWGARAACSARAAPSVVSEGDRTVVARGVLRSEAHDVGEVFASIPEVLWVEPIPTYTRHNFDAASLTQSGKAPPVGGIPVGRRHQDG